MAYRNVNFPLGVTLRFVAVIFNALFSFACTREVDFQRWGLPKDLPLYLGQIKVLKVPSHVTSLNWIPPNIKDLDASATAITATPLPNMGLERLDVHAAKELSYLAGLPPSLRELDIRFTQIEGPWIFPQDLESLALGGERVRTLDGLSTSMLLELNLEDVPNLRSSAGMPISLRRLSISGATFGELVDLPPQLNDLRLQNTQIRVLDNLPDSLQSLTLISNSLMEVKLPNSLLSLTLDRHQQGVTSLDDLRFLNLLETSPPAVPSSLPSFLRELRLPSAHVPSVLREFPPSLRRLDIISRGIGLFALPSSLQELRWVGGSELSQLPPSVKHLDIPATPLKDLSALPFHVSLDSLDVSWSHIPINKLPSSLLDLRYRFCRFTSISGLPKMLRSLDLAGSRDVRELELPSNLQRLNVSETSIEDLPKLPASLVELDISNTSIRSLAQLKGLRMLRRLTLHAGQIESLYGLPQTVDELLFVNDERN